MKPSRFESAVMDYIAENADDDALTLQLQSVEIRERDHTGVGCFAKLSLLSGERKTEKNYGTRGPLMGPTFESPVVNHGGMTLLWFEGGFADTLEIVTFEGDFAADHADLEPFVLDGRVVSINSDERCAES